MFPGEHAFGNECLTMAGENLLYAGAKVLLNNELPAHIDIGLEEKLVKKA